jgi:lipopolysaccharide export system permease protein
MIITRYVAWEISRPFLIVVGACAAIFASYTTAVFLNDVAAGLLPAATVAKLVLIKLLIATEVLLPVSLYFAVVFGLGRLHSDSEIIVLSASGFGEARLVSIILRYSLVIAVLVASISWIARPWAYQQQYQLLAQARTEIDIADLEAKQIFVGPGSDYAVFADTVDHVTRTAGAVIVQIREAGAMRVVVAKRLFQPPAETGVPVVLVFEEGFLYRLDRAGRRDLVGKFNELRLTLAAPEPDIVGYKSKAQGTLALSGSSQPKDLAEFQWRLCTPTATVLIALLAVPVSRSSPRRGRFGKVLTAILAYAVFYNAMTFAKNLVQEGFVGAVPGLWWPLMLLGLLLLALFWRPWRRFRV